MVTVAVRPRRPMTWRRAAIIGLLIVLEVQWDAGGACSPPDNARAADTPPAAVVQR